MSNRPPNVYQRYVDEVLRHRSGTRTYLPNHVLERETTTLVQVTTMAIGRGIGTSIQNHELLGAATVATK